MPRHRFGYLVYRADGLVDATVLSREASSEVVAELEQLTAALFEIQPIVFAMELVERNYRELHNGLREHNEAMSAAAHGDKALTQLEGLIAMSQRTTNFLASASAFLGACETRLKRVHGHNSGEVSTWLDRKRALHAAHFAYRFLYELRNFAQHATLPISTLTSAGTIDQNSHAWRFTSGVLVSRDELLDESFNWKAPLIPEIRAQPAEFELMDLVETYVNCLRRLCLEGVDLKAARLVELDHYLVAVIRFLRLPTYAHAVLFIGESAGPNVAPAAHKLIPIQQRNWLLDRVNRLRQECRISTPEALP